MSHLDTAYKLGAAAAWNDFQRELEKQGLEATPPPNITGGQAPPVPVKPPAPTKTPPPVAPPLAPRQPGVPPPAPSRF